MSHNIKIKEIKPLRPSSKYHSSNSNAALNFLLTSNFHNHKEQSTYSQEQNTVFQSVLFFILHHYEINLH